MIVQSASSTTKTTDISFSVGRTDMKKAVDIITKSQNSLEFETVVADPNVSKISVVGTAMRSQL